MNDLVDRIEMLIMIEMLPIDKIVFEDEQYLVFELDDIVEERDMKKHQ
jgi:hypothetical protein